MTENIKLAKYAAIFEDIKAGDIMSSHVVEISADKKIAHAKELMKIKKISGIPVVDEKRRLIGIISIEDIIHALEFNSINDPIRKHHDQPGRHHPPRRLAGRGGGQVRELQVRPLPGGRRRQPRLRHHQQGRHPARHPGKIQPHLHPRPEAHQHAEHRVFDHHRREAEQRGGRIPLPASTATTSTPPAPAPPCSSSS